MLVLARRVGERILIGDDVVVTVLELSREQVRIGIHAPRSLSVHREEVYQEILLANVEAADNSPDSVPPGPYTAVMPPKVERVNPAKGR